MAGDELPEVELARDLIAVLAPGEQPLFPVIARKFVAIRKKAALRSGGDDVLGFGLAEAATLLTPIALAAAEEVVRYIAEEIGKEIAGEITTRIRGLIHREPSGERLNQAQLTRIHLIAENVARRAKLPAPKAGALADAIVQRLS